MKDLYIHNLTPSSQPANAHTWYAGILNYCQALSKNKLTKIVAHTVSGCSEYG